jgi:hypothetical protein
MTLLAIDPGKHVGWSLWTYNGFEIGRGVFEFEDLHKRLHLETVGELTLEFNHPDLPAGAQWHTVRWMVCEDYIGRPGQKNGGQRFWGPECIGAVETLAHLGGVEFRRQRAVDVLQISALHAGYKLPKGHLPDEDSAWLHGRYRLEQLGVLRAEPLD